MKAHRFVLAAVLAAAVLAFGCNRGPTLETRTFELHYVRGAVAKQIILPYVFTDRANAPGMVSAADKVVTVRETPDNLDKIARVLAQIDKPAPSVRLHFQLIEADGTAPTDPRIADVETQLKKLFRFAGYRLIGEAYAAGTPGSGVQQDVAGTGGLYFIQAGIEDVSGTGDSGIVHLTVQLRQRGATGIRAAVDARNGQTVVLGNAPMGTSTKTVVLTVKPEITWP